MARTPPPCDPPYLDERQYAVWLRRTAAALPRARQGYSVAQIMAELDRLVPGWCEALDVLRWTWSLKDVYGRSASPEEMLIGMAKSAAEYDFADYVDGHGQHAFPPPSLGYGSRLTRAEYLSLGVDPIVRYARQRDTDEERLEYVQRAVASHPFVSPPGPKTLDVLLHSQRPFDVDMLLGTKLDYLSHWVRDFMEGTSRDGVLAIQALAIAALAHDVIDELTSSAVAGYRPNALEENPHRHAGHLRPGHRVALVGGRTTGMVVRVFPQHNTVWIVTDDEPPEILPVRWEDIERAMRVVPGQTHEDELTPNHDFSFEAYWNAVEDARRQIYPGVNADAVLHQAAHDFIGGQYTRAIDVMRWSVYPSWTHANQYPTAADALLAWGTVTMVADIIGPGLPGFPQFRGQRDRERQHATVHRPSLISDEQYWDAVHQMATYALRHSQPLEWVWNTLPMHPLLSNIYRVFDVLEHTRSLEAWSSYCPQPRDILNMIRGTVQDTMEFDRALKALARTAFAEDIAHKVKAAGGIGGARWRPS